jgi:hypothetical protein
MPKTPTVFQNQVPGNEFPILDFAELRLNQRPFWDLVDKTKQPPHWLWKLHLENTYGMFHWHGKKYVAHRIAWQLIKNERLNPTTQLRRTKECQYHHCVNPDHVYPKIRKT